MGHYEIMEQNGREAFGAAILVNPKLERKKQVKFLYFQLIYEKLNN